MQKHTWIFAVCSDAPIYQSQSVCVGSGFRGTTQGTVTDTNNAVIPNATVTLLNTATGVKRVETTNETGHYIFNLADPGTYTISAVASGFASNTHRDVLLLTRGDVNLDLSISVAGGNDTVVIEANVNQVEFNSSTVSTTLDSKLVEETPNYGRNPFLLATLDPAVQNTALRQPPLQRLGIERTADRGQSGIQQRRSNRRRPDRAGPQEQLHSQHRRRQGSTDPIECGGRGIWS